VLIVRAPGTTATPAETTLRRDADKPVDLTEVVSDTIYYGGLDNATGTAHLIEQALQQVDDENRRTMLQRATELAMSDLGLMPVHFQFTIWATKKNVQYTPRTDEYTLAFQFRPTSKQP
jgi:ABC-type transport system substrate-binding protein